MAKEREDKVKSFRILEIDGIIREGNYPNSTYLAKRFEVSRSTISRDIEFLRDRYNAPLEFDQVKNGYYYSDPTFFIQSVMLTEGELFTVGAILPLLEQYKNTPLEQSFRTMMTKITEMLPDSVSVDTSFVTSEIKFISDPLPQIDNSIFTQIFDSIRTKRTLEFGYRSIAKQDYHYRKFNPFRVVCQKGNWYVIGHDHKSSEIRIFSMARMKDLKVLNEKFTVPKDFKLDKYIDSSFGIWLSKTEPVKIELLFDKSVNTYILERNWHQTQECYQKEDGSVYLSFKSNQMQETLHWVLNFGSAVKVLNPPELIKAVKNEIQKLSQIYD